MCVMEFKQELEYWDINPDLIGDCCWNQYRPFLLPDRDHAPSPDPDGCRETMWKILELKHSGPVSKVTKYFVTTRKVIFLHPSVILFTGGSASVHAGIPTPTPREQTPLLEQTPPSSRPPLGADTLPRSRHPPKSRHPQEQTPPESTVHVGRYGQ